MASIVDILTLAEGGGTLDVIAITDHDEIRGSLEAREMAAQRGYHLQVVPGIEVTTNEGHLLALFMEHPVARLQPLEHTIEAIHEQGGLCIVPHPMSWLTESIGLQGMERIMSSPDDAIYFDGIEVVNATLAGRVCNGKAHKFRERYHLAATGGSDAHFLTAVGSGLTLFPGHSAQDLKQALVQATTQACNGKKVPFSDIGLTQLVRQQIKSRGFSLRNIVKNMVREITQ